jgi:hypothetical protein
MIVLSHSESIGVAPSTPIPHSTAATVALVAQGRGALAWAFLQRAPVRRREAATMGIAEFYRGT